jgi:ketosteroid isomerase-like protein
MFGALLLQRWTEANFGRPVARKDVDAIMRGWSDDGVFEMPGTSAISGRFEGKTAIDAWVRKWLGSMATIDFTVKRVALTNTLAFGFTTNDVMIEMGGPGDLAERGQHPRSRYYGLGAPPRKARGGT